MNRPKSHLVLWSFLFATIFASPVILLAQMRSNPSAAEIQLALQKMQTMGSVLYIGAHPDDENNDLLSYLAQSAHYRTAYLSATRGDGGQNHIGDELGASLGILRTQELLAARRIDGGEQFFSRALDFGYTTSPEATLKKWGHEAILADFVWVIRRFQPDIMIARFPTTGEGRHGHHTASAILAGEAFRAAADPQRFPEQLEYVQPWQAKKVTLECLARGHFCTRWRSCKIDQNGYRQLQSTAWAVLYRNRRSSAQHAQMSGDGHAQFARP